MTIEEKLIKIAENDQSIYNDLNSLLQEQEDYYTYEEWEMPDIEEVGDIGFYLDDTKINFLVKFNDGTCQWSECIDQWIFSGKYETLFFSSNTNGYIAFMHQAVTDETGEFIKTEDEVIENNRYYLSNNIEFSIIDYNDEIITTIQLQTGNAYAKAKDYIFHLDNRFTKENDFVYFQLNSITKYRINYNDFCKQAILGGKVYAEKV